MTGSLAPKRVAGYVAASSAAIVAATAGAIAAGAPDTAAVGAGVAVFGVSAIAGAVRLGVKPAR